MTILKSVKVKRTVYSGLKNAPEVRQYIIDCVKTGSEALLYKDPAISSEFYTEGTAAADAIQTAIDDNSTATNDERRKAIKTTMQAGKFWLDAYADKVQPIANDPANRNTREEASLNISKSFLSAQKLDSNAKGNPETPVLIVKNLGESGLGIEVTNPDSYAPSRTNFIAIQLPSSGVLPVVTLVNGQLKVVSSVPSEITTQSLSGKGHKTAITISNTGSSYIVYAYAQNGNKEVSGLSRGITIKM